MQTPGIDGNGDEVGTVVVAEVGAVVAADSIDVGDAEVFFGAAEFGLDSGFEVGVVDEKREEAGESEEEPEEGDLLVAGGEPDDDEDLGLEPEKFNGASESPANFEMDLAEDEEGPMPKSEPIRSQVRVSMAKGLLFESN